MTSRFDVWLDGISLTSLHPGIYITDVKQSTVGFADTRVSVGKKDGSILQRRALEQLDYTVTFMLREYNPAARQSAVDVITAWAMTGGALTDSTHEDKFLDVICTAPPRIESALRWTDDLSITFTAYGMPYWQDSEPAVFSHTGTSGGGTVFGKGSAADCIVYGTVKATGGALTTLMVRAGTSFMEFSDMTVTQNGTVTFGYDDHYIYCVKWGNASQIRRRTGESSDELRVPMQTASEFEITANVSVTSNFYVRGLYL